jgi:hypothetical protein
VSPTHRRRKAGVLVVLAVVAAAVVAAVLVLRPAHPTDLATDGTSTGATTSGSPAEGVSATSSAAATSTSPYTIKPEPSRVATDTPVKTTSGHADVVLTYAGFEDSSGTVQANGFVAGVIEEGGTCTLTLTMGGQEVSATSTASADATTTSCGLLETSGSLLPGTWDAVLSYSSEDTEGTSEHVAVTVR